MNTFGNIFKLTTFGESHGEALGGVIDGMPSGIDVDMEFIQSELDRRRPGQSRLTTARKEGDRVELGVARGDSAQYLDRLGHRGFVDLDGLLAVLSDSSYAMPTITQQITRISRRYTVHRMRTTPIR